jgi:hypothetical protein
VNASYTYIVAGNRPKVRHIYADHRNGPAACLTRARGRWQAATSAHADLPVCEACERMAPSRAPYYRHPLEQIIDEITAEREAGQ